MPCAPCCRAANSRGEDLADLLDLLVSAGDLLELRQSGDTPGACSTSGRPRTSSGGPGQYLLLGIRPFGAPLISSGLAGAIQYEGHTRTIELSPDRAAAQLSELGLHMIRRRAVGTPATGDAAGRTDQADAGAALRRRPCRAGRGADGHRPGAKVTYYRGRWRSLKPADSGLFVARRPQAYGADLWCVVLVAGGAPVRLLDLPADDPAAPGHDEAWRVQAALDAAAGQSSGVPRRRRCRHRRQRGQDGRLLLAAPPVGGAVPATRRHGRSKRTAGRAVLVPCPRGRAARPCRLPRQHAVDAPDNNGGGGMTAEAPTIAETVDPDPGRSARVHRGDLPRRPPGA